MMNQTKETVTESSRHLRAMIEQRDKHIEILHDLIEGGRERELQLLQTIKDLVGVGHNRG